VDNIRKMEQQREERRRAMEEKKVDKAKRDAQNKLAGKVVDIDFDMMIE
jgi:kinesin family protein 2/24